MPFRILEFGKTEVTVHRKFLKKIILIRSKITSGVDFVVKRSFNLKNQIFIIKIYSFLQRSSYNPAPIRSSSKKLNHSSIDLNKNL